MPTRVDYGDNPAVRLSFGGPGLPPTGRKASLAGGRPSLGGLADGRPSLGGLAAGGRPSLGHTGGGRVSLAGVAEGQGEGRGGGDERRRFSTAPARRESLVSKAKVSSPLPASHSTGVEEEEAAEADAVGRRRKEVCKHNNTNDNSSYKNNANNNNIT